MRTAIFLMAILTMAVGSQAAPVPDVHKVLTCTFNKNRIVIFEYSGISSKSALEAYLEAQPPKNSVGGFTAAYYYKKGATLPRSGQTLCESIAKANEILYESNSSSAWDFAYMQEISGDKEVVDCRADTGSALCR